MGHFLTISLLFYAPKGKVQQEVKKNYPDNGERANLGMKYLKLQYFVTIFPSISCMVKRKTSPGGKENYRGIHR